MAFTFRRMCSWVRCPILIGVRFPACSMPTGQRQKWTLFHQCKYFYLKLIRNLGIINIYAVFLDNQTPVTYWAMIMPTWVQWPTQMPFSTLKQFHDLSQRLVWRVRLLIFNMRLVEIPLFLRYVIFPKQFRIKILEYYVTVGSRVWK